MVIADAIREAETEYVVYFLLEAYLNTASRRDALKDLPARITLLPLTGRHDAKSRFAMLMNELDAASRRLDDAACTAIKEALAVFSAAVQRLQSLDCRRSLLTRGAVLSDDAPQYAYSPPVDSVPKASSQA